MIARDRLSVYLCIFMQWTDIFPLQRFKRADFSAFVTVVAAQMQP